jgi:hypothetical protein
MRAKAGTRIAALIVAVAAIAVPQAATAATTIGQTFAPTQACGVDVTYLQTASPGFTYAAPSAGVITQWQFQAGATPAQMKLKVARLVSGSSYKIVGEDPTLRTPEANKLNAYPVKISVAAGDMIGPFIKGTGNCAKEVGPAFAIAFYVVAEPTVGNTYPFTPFQQLSNSQFDIAATLEADGDGDGFGDESQDGCPADPARQAPPCAAVTNPGTTPPADIKAPETTISKKPPAKTKKKKATFEFTSSEAGSSFQCQLDGKGFKPCSSPLTTAKLKKGKHSFEVKATDAAGNADATAASASWKIVKKKAPKKAARK